MHYRNGREAKNGDKIVMVNNWGAVMGILYDAQTGNDSCNGKVAAIRPNDPCPNLKECLHLDDVVKFINDGMAKAVLSEVQENSTARPCTPEEQVQAEELVVAAKQPGGA